MSENSDNAPQDSSPPPPAEPPRTVPADSSPFRMPEGSGVKGGDNMCAA